MRGMRLVLAACLLLGLGCGKKKSPVQPAPDPGPQSPGEVVSALVQAYSSMSWQELADLLAPDYLFFLSEPTDQGKIQWDAAEEARIHRRMFDPANLPAAEPPVPAALWLQHIDIALVSITDWTERTDLYRSEGNPAGLDPARWKASEARYSTFVFFTTAGEFDFLVKGQANFVVLEDLEVAAGEKGKFLLYRWEDLDVPSVRVGPAVIEQMTWSKMKQLYD